MMTTRFPILLFTTALAASCLPRPAGVDDTQADGGSGDGGSDTGITGDGGGSDGGGSDGGGDSGGGDSGDGGSSAGGSGDGGGDSGGDGGSDRGGDGGSDTGDGGTTDDGDGDGFTVADGDCDDTEADVNPDATEVCDNGRDDDCDGLGSPCGLSGTFDSSDAAMAAAGFTSTSGLGSAVALIGDYDGKAGSEIALGAPQATSLGLSSGAAYLLAPPVVKSPAIGDVYARISAVAAGEEVGAAVASAGDLDGDGRQDWVIGAPGWEPSVLCNATGEVLVLSGGTAGSYNHLDVDLRLVTSCDDEDGLRAGTSLAGGHDLTGDFDDDLVIGSDGGFAWIWVGGFGTGDGELGGTSSILISTGSSAGGSLVVASPGDVTGDGIADVVVGVPEASVSASGGGAVYLVEGPIGGAVELASDGVGVYGDVADMVLGVSVSGGGDLDGDGTGDFVVGSPWYSAGGFTDGGAAWLLGPGLVGGNVSSVAAASVIGSDDDQWLGWSVGGDVDLDGNGTSDALVGAPGANADNGAVYGVLGPWAGVATVSGSTFTFNGDSASQAGWAVSAGPDVDDDGRGDLLIGGPTASSDDGAAWLLLNPTGW